jgi:hypothetical protein
MIHYAQSLLLAHLAEAAPRPIPMTPCMVGCHFFVVSAARTINRDWIACTHEFISCSRNMSGILVVLPVLVAAIFWWNIQLEVPPRVESTPHLQAGNTMGCGPNGVVFPYFLARKYHPGGILAITR